MPAKMVVVEGLVKFHILISFSRYTRDVFVLARLITPSPILYNRSSIKEKNLFFDDIFTGAHHYFLKVQGQSYILAGGLNNFHQIGTRFID